MVYVPNILLYRTTTNSSQPTPVDLLGIGLLGSIQTLLAAGVHRHPSAMDIHLKHIETISAPTSTVGTMGASVILALVPALRGCEAVNPILPVLAPYPTAWFMDARYGVGLTFTNHRVLRKRARRRMALEAVWVKHTVPCLVILNSSVTVICMPSLMCVLH